MSSIDRRTFLSFSGGAATVATLNLAGCGGGGDNFPPVASASKGPQALAKDGRKFEAVANSHSLVITETDGRQKAYGGVGSAQGKLNYPVGVAVINNLGYVVEMGNSRVQVFDGLGNSLGLIGVGTLGFPSAIAAGTNEFFVSDARHARIVGFSPSGEVTRILGAGKLGAPAGLVVVEDGLIVADPGYRRVVKLGFDGTVRTKYGKDWVAPSGVATDGNFVYVADVSRNELARLTMGGEAAGAMQLAKAPSNVSFRSGTLFVS